MVSENVFVQTSGTLIGIGSSTLGMAMLMVESGTGGIFVPMAIGDLK